MDYNKLLEEAKTSKKKLNLLKNLLVSFSKYEEAASLRKIELESFPDSEEVKTAKEQLEKWKILFAMLDVNADDKTIWNICTGILQYDANENNFSLNDAVKIKNKRDSLFED